MYIDKQYIFWANSHFPSSCVSSLNVNFSRQWVLLTRMRTLDSTRQQKATLQRWGWSQTDVYLTITPATWEQNKTPWFSLWRSHLSVRQFSRAVVMWMPVGKLRSSFICKTGKKTFEESKTRLEQRNSKFWKRQSSIIGSTLLQYIQTLKHTFGTQRCYQNRGQKIKQYKNC